MATAADVANYFLAVADPEDGLSNLKLQKMCSYAQAIALALGEPLFEEDIQAWTHGPVIPSIYKKYKRFGRETIEQSGMSSQYARQPFSAKQNLILELVNAYYGQYTANVLRNRSHDDFPGEFGSMRSIPKDAIRDKFATFPLVRKVVKDTVSCKFDPSQDKIISEQEFWGAVSS